MRKAIWALLLSTAFFARGVTAADIRITLNRAFIDEFKNRATISDTCFIDKALKTPHPAAEDADIHIAARCDTAGLPTVIEIMNAAAEPAALKAVHAAEGNNTKISVTGAWRIWCEHGGTSKQIQGASMNDPINTTNPDHVFEIHPVLKFGNSDVVRSIHKITGYSYKDAEEAFSTYERTRCRLQPKNDTVTILTTMAGYNYVKFTMTLIEDPHPISDGVQVFASVTTADGDLLVNKRRMVAVKGTAAANAIGKAHKGDSVTVLGIPRLDLSLIAWRVDHAAEDPEALDWDLPYEMIVVALL